MTSMKMTVEVITPVPVITRRIRESIADKINVSIRLSIPRIREKVGDILEDSIRNSHEINELLDGNLRHELGATRDEAEATINFLIQRLDKTIQIDFKPFTVFGGRFGGYIQVSCFPKTLLDELSSFPKASFLTKKGVKIPWMEWLLFLGDRIIIKKYNVYYSNVGGSRTGRLKMKPVKVGGWRVPPGFSGTRRNNFITRALDDIADYVGYIMRAEIYKQI